MDHESGQLSIDLIIGFAIFMIAFIFVATLSSGLLLGLQSKTIDYDAVAYRTGVILTEDPGSPNVDPYEINQEPGKVSWEYLSNPLDTVRFGLAISKEHPGILDRRKVESFFDRSNFSYPDDYRNRLLLNPSGQYPYQFNISLIQNSTIHSIGDPPPQKYGYIKRAVFIKEPPEVKNYTFAGNNSYINITINLRELKDPERGAVYWLDPTKDSLGVRVFQNPGFLSKVALYQKNQDNPIPGYNAIIVLIDNETSAKSGPVNSNVKAEFTPGDLERFLPLDEVVLRFQFVPMLNDTSNQTDYDYDVHLSNAILEVKIW